MAPRSKRGRTRHAVSHEDDDGAWRDDDACALRADEAREGEAAFTRYYRDAQRICRDAEDWRALLASLRTPLPVSFRVSRVAARQPEVAAALSIAEPLLRTSHPLGARGSRTAPPARRFASVHGLDAWQLGCDARALRQAAKHAPESALAALGRWIIEHNASGVLTRQELVSMIPVALLEVQPGQAVLDLCAAPGSKSTQALEALLSPPPPAARLSRGAGGAHAGVQPADGSAQPRSELALARGGLLVANELDGERSHTLANRCAALGAACAALVVTAQRAQTMPLANGCGQFDRVICDVPCSGDGTFRKYPDKWSHYEPYIGRTLHALQLQIALRGAASLAPGGLIAYSTCSLNPLENEAVVGALIRATGGALELLDAARRLDGQLVTRPGLTSWKVLDDADQPLQSHALVRAAARRTGCAHGARYRASMWPADAAGNDLRRCVRLLPHDNDTGGFFVALLRKRAPWPPPRVARRVVPSSPPSLEPHVQSALLVEGGAAVRALSQAQLTDLRLEAPALRLLLDALGGGALGERGWLVLCERSLRAVGAGARSEREHAPRRLFLCTARAASIVGAAPELAGGERPAGVDRPLRAVAIGACVAVRRRVRARPRRAGAANAGGGVKGGSAPTSEWLLTPLGARVARAEPPG